MQSLKIFHSRLLLYGSFLIIWCSLIQSSVAEIRNYKRSKDNEDSSVERPSKYKGEKKYKLKYKTELEDDSDEDFKINMHHKKPWEDHSEFGRDRKYTFSKKVNVHAEADHTYKNKKSYDGRKHQKIEDSGRGFGKKKASIADEDSDEDFVEARKQFGKNSKKKLEEDVSAEKTSRSRKYPTKQKDDKIDDDEEDSGEETVKFAKKSQFSDDSDESEEAPKKKFRKKIRVRVPDSPEDSDESDEDDGTCQKKSHKGKGGKSCRGESTNGNEAEDEPVRPKKIKYSIKFAHEKEKNVPNEDSNIMLKIHRGEKKKYKYKDDDDDDSSEENAFPKRFRFVDDDDD